MPSRIKGATILNTLGMLREITDKPRYQSLVEACPAPTQEFLQRTLMAVEWVAVELWSPMLTVIFERITGHDEIKFRKFMRAVCKRDFAGPYRVYVQNADAGTLLGKSQGIWGAYFDTGTLLATAKEAAKAAAKEVDRERPSYLLELRGLESEATLYLSAVHAFIEQLLIVVEAKNPVVLRHRELVLMNRMSCDFTVTFG